MAQETKQARHMRIINTFANDPFLRFDSVADFLAWREPLGGVDYPKRWAGGTFAGALAACRGGDLAAVPKAEKYADMLNDAVDIAGRVDSWRLDVSGAFCCVPEYLAGSPECMYQMTAEKSTAAPLDVCIDITASCNVSAANMRRRGVLVLAACLALSRVRPVNVWCYSSDHIGRILVRLSSPFDVSEICAFVTRPDVSRCLFVGASHIIDAKQTVKNRYNNVGWAPWSHDQAGQKRALVELGGVSDDCLVIGPGVIGKWDDLSDDDFVRELNGIIDNARSGV